MSKTGLSLETITSSGNKFMKSERYRHGAQFKAKIVFEAAKNVTIYIKTFFLIILSSSGK
jgi:hypothetical protein